MNPIHYKINPAPPNSPVFIRIHHEQAKKCDYDADESESDELNEDCTELHGKVEGQGQSKPIAIPPKQEWINQHFGD